MAIEWIGGLVSGARFAWKHRRDLTTLGSLRELVEDRQRLQTRVQELEAEVAKLRQPSSAPDLHAGLRYEFDCYWTLPAAGQASIPVCPVCLDTHGRRIYMTDWARWLKCQSCGALVKNPDHVPPHTGPRRPF